MSSSDDSSSPSYPMNGVAYPGVHDVICGRGGHVISHPGNVKFRALVEQFKAGYVQASRYAKAEITADVVRFWRQQTPPGRFLIMTDPSKADASTWHDIGGKGATKKVAQCLRERNPRSEYVAKAAAAAADVSSSSMMPAPSQTTTTVVASADVFPMPQVALSGPQPMDWNQTGKPQEFQMTNLSKLPQQQARRQDITKNNAHHQQHQHQSKHAVPTQHKQKKHRNQRQHQQAQRQQQNALNQQARQVQKQVEQAEQEVWEAQQTVNQQAQHLQEALQQRTQQEAAVAFATAAMNQQQVQAQVQQQQPQTAQPALSFDQNQQAQQQQVQQQAQQKALNDAAMAAVAAATAFGNQNALQSMLHIQQDQPPAPTPTMSEGGIQQQQLKQQQDLQQQQLKQQQDLQQQQLNEQQQLNQQQDLQQHQQLEQQQQLEQKQVQQEQDIEGQNGNSEDESLSPLLWGSSPQGSTNGDNDQQDTTLSPSRRQSLSARDSTVALSMPSAANLTQAFDDDSNNELSDSSNNVNAMAKALYGQLESFSDTSSELDGNNESALEEEENAGSDASVISDGDTSIARGNPYDTE